MSRTEKVTVVALIVALAFYGGSVRPHKIRAQALTSNQPQDRIVGLTAVSIGQTVTSVACPTVTTTDACVVPTTGTGGASGIALQSGTTGQHIFVMMTGIAECLFDNTPVLLDLAIVTPGSCHDSAITSASGILNTQGMPGRITGLIDSTHAWITMYEPGSVGRMVSATTFDPASVPDYIKAHQTLQVNSDWNATSGLAQILNKPTFQPPDLTGTGTMPAAVLVIAGCSSNATASISGAVKAKRVDIQNTDGSLPAVGAYYQGSVTAAGTVTYRQCSFLALTLAATPVTFTVGQ